MQVGPHQLGPDRERVALATLVAVIARSQIVVAQRAEKAEKEEQEEKPEKTGPLFPAGFDAVDIAILDWIAVDSRRLSRSFMRM